MGSPTSASEAIPSNRSAPHPVSGTTPRWGIRVDEVITVWWKTNSTYWCREKHNVITKHQVRRGAWVAGSIRTGPAPKSTCAASAGVKVSGTSLLPNRSCTATGTRPASVNVPPARSAAHQKRSPPEPRSPISTASPTRTIFPMGFGGNLPAIRRNPQRIKGLLLASNLIMSAI
jgi:hypothetical protein